MRQLTSLSERECSRADADIGLRPSNKSSDKWRHRTFRDLSTRRKSRNLILDCRESPFFRPSGGPTRCGPGRITAVRDVCRLDRTSRAVSGRRARKSSLYSQGFWNAGDGPTRYNLLITYFRRRGKRSENCDKIGNIIFVNSMRPEVIGRLLNT